MKKLLLIIAGICTLLATSCNREEMDVTRGEEVTISFTASIPGGIATKAISDGNTATVLQYAVYDATTEGTSTLLFTNSAELSNGNATVDITLVSNMKYDILFWAQAEGAPYNFDASTQSMTITDVTSLVSNNEAYDAFYYAEKGYVAMKSASNDIRLVRPFAQVNLATTDEDITLAEKSGVSPETVKMTIKGMYTTFNLFDGTVSNPTNDVVTFAEHSIVDENETLLIKSEDKYRWLAMNYLLVPAEGSVFDVTFTLTTNKSTIDYTLNNLPLKRNYKTNVYGNLITDSNRWNISIDDEILEGDNISYEDVKTVDEFLNAIQNGRDARMLNDIDAKDIDLVFGEIASTTASTRAETSGVEVNIDLGGFKLTANSIKVMGSNNEVTFSNGNLELDTEDLKNAIYIQSTESTFNMYGVEMTTPAENAITVGNNNTTELKDNTINLYNSTITVVDHKYGTGIMVSGVQDININSSEINYKYFGVYQNGTHAGSNFTIVDTKITGEKLGIYLSNCNQNEKNFLMIDKCEITSNSHSAIEIKKTDVTTIRRSTLKSLRRTQGYGFNAGGGYNAGYAIAFAGHVENEPYEGEINLEDNEYIVTAENGSPIFYYGYGEGDFKANCGAFQTAEEVFIFNEEGLRWLASEINAMNTFKGVTVNLMSDIDLGNGEWTPMGNVVSYPSCTFAGTFNGNGKTISNFKASASGDGGVASAGLFGSITGKVQNLNIDNATITSTHYAGGVVGFSSTNGMEISKCKVTNSTITSGAELQADGSYDNGDKVGGIIGYMVVSDVVKDCSVENITIKGYRDLGGIVGYSNGTVTGCSVNNVKIYVDPSHNYNGYTTPKEYDANSIVGEGNSDASNTATNVSISYTDGLMYYPATNTYEVSTGNGLAYASAHIFAKIDDQDKIVNIVNDIDMTNIAYTPAEFNTNSRALTINGNDKIISNLSVKNVAHAGLIGQGFHMVTIKDLTIKDSEFSTTDADDTYCGAFIAYFENNASLKSSLVNCKAINVTYGSSKYVGGLIGGMFGSPDFSIKDCLVEKANITSEYTEDNGTNYKGHCGGVIGGTYAGTVSNTSVKNSIITAKGPRVGAFAGSAMSATKPLTFGEGDIVDNVMINSVKATSDEIVGDVNNSVGADKVKVL